MVKDTQEHCNEFRIASIQPRDVYEAILSCFDDFNAVLAGMYSENGLTLVKDDVFIKLQDGIKIMLKNKASTNRLAKKTRSIPNLNMPNI